MTSKNEFLAILPPHLRGSCFNLFLHEARNGAVGPAQVITRVMAALTRRTATSQEQSLANARLMLSAVRDNISLAIGCADAALLHDKRPVEERQSEREHDRRIGVNAWMERQLPSEKQIKYLHSLGCFDDPENMRHASELIEQIKQRRAGQ